MQKFRFAELYKSNKEAVREALLSMWCGETKNKSQESYKQQLTGLIGNLFAPGNAMPLVQCMNTYESVHTVPAEAAESIVGGLWRKSMNPGVYYPPFEHQYQSWNTLLNERTADEKYKSICVTTSTGSGKTECFMMPLVKDLIDHRETGTTQAIFLYPLNALMEDQKERLEKLVAGTGLKYAVYNGDLPEKVPNPDDANYDAIMNRINSIRGREYDENGDYVDKYPNCITTREELRRNPANILLTNPTMLEYVLLRDKDSKLVNSERKSLRWVVIDETHTYTGAGAAEMAMLLRRVLMAFDVTSDQVRFATSSATIGNKGPEGIKELKQFISGITGVGMNQVAVIDGKRKGADSIADDEFKPYWEKLINDNKDGFMSLAELMPEPESIEGKLRRLDEMCQTAEEKGKTDLRAKVHYFYRVPNCGFYVDLMQYGDGSFKVYTENDPEAGRDGRAPFLELSRCKHCGEYVAVAEADYTESTYSPITMDESDMFDLGDDEETTKKFLVFALSDKDVTREDSNVSLMIQGNQFTEGVHYRNGWQVIANTQCCCPYCGTKLTKRNGEDDENIDAPASDAEDNKKLAKFRVPSEFISRLIAPSTLDQMTPFVPGGGKKVMHQGQQYISFVDSRQGAAQATIKQNLEEERLWLYSNIFHELSHMAGEHMHIPAALEECQKQIQEAAIAGDFTKIAELSQKLQQLQTKSGVSYLSWKDIYDLLRNNEWFETFCRQFAERSEYSKEFVNGKLTEEVKERYAHSIMVEYLSKRPLSAPYPETMGLFTSYYPKLEDSLSNPLPERVVEFNGLLASEWQISQKDWHDLMQIFMDYTVRSNQSVYLRMSDADKMDIFKCVRFATQKERRRSARKPQVKEKAANTSRVIRLLAHLVAKSKNISLGDAIKGYGTQINTVIDAMWDDLIDRYGLLTCSTQYDEESRQHIKDKDFIKDDIHYTPYRLNLADLGFKLYDHVSLCDTNTRNEHESRHVACLRPVDTLFKGFSPYLIGGEPVSPLPDNIADWKPYPYPFQHKSPEEVEEWAKENRKLLWNNDIWGKEGCFSRLLDTIYGWRDLFIQAEHTAQVDKVISRQVQKDFKNHLINILACSTTMEMGVNLGDLELVMMTSVPPMPSNYKQRSGRSGRNGQPRSAAVTLCGSDAVGMRALLHPMENLILRNVNTPTVDLDSAQVVQRHVNAFLVREFGVFNLGQHGGSIMQSVLDYYTNFTFDEHGGQKTIIRKIGHSPVGPADGLGEPEGTPYEAFNNICSEVLSPDDERHEALYDKLGKLLDHTIFAGRMDYVIRKSRAANERCYEELERKIGDLKLVYQQAKTQKQRNFFMVKYIEPLDQQLLSYWATHRFTPNANMPVNVVEFDINSSSSNYYSTRRPSNPSYPLRTALAQYAPGNPIARDGMVRIVRGVRYTNFFKPTTSFKKLYHNDEQVVIDMKDELDGLYKWPVSQSTELELLQPSEFIPDMNESASRILDKNDFTRVNAQLIGTEKWAQDRTEPHLFDARSSRESGDAQILYYNEGTGYGYCHCTKCGRTVLESWAAANAADPEKLPSEMNPIDSSDSNKPKYHYSLVRKGNKPERCFGCNNPEHIRRNVVLGDTIQTDFVEIRIRHLNEDWISRRDDNVELLTTLGILFTQALAETLNIERQDVDFTVTQNGHICVFDTNPGGSGYSNQLAAMDLLKEVIKKSRGYIEIAEQAKSKDVLIDKQTLHYLNLVDISKAKAWIDEELSAQRVLPAAIQSVFPDATETSLAKMEQAFRLAQHESFLFVDNDYLNWDYDDPTHGWKARFYPEFGNRGHETTFCVMESEDTKMPEPDRNMLYMISAWMKKVTGRKNPYAKLKLYPLAYIEGCLYFTNNPEHRSLNDRWAGGTMYYARVNNPALSASKLDVEPRPNQTSIFKLEGHGFENISTSELGKVIADNSREIVDKFMNHCRNNPDELLKVNYQDEHLKSILGIVLALQTIGYFVKQIGADFYLTFLLERYDTANNHKESITANLPDYVVRDKWLKELTNSWLDELEQETDIDGRLTPIESLPKRTLPHWRVLSLEYAGKRLSIYPDGGFMNGWTISRDNPRYDTSDITGDAQIKLHRTEDIKYDVTIEDV